MKNQIKKILLFGLLMINTIAFAFPADPDPTVDPPAPIDANLILLAIAGIVFCYAYLNRKLKTD